MVESTLDQCIKCNICVSYCPVTAVTDLFPGPKYEGPQAGRFRQPDQPSPDHSVDYCSGCRVCNMVCPTGVRIAEINARARAEIVRQHGLPLRNRLLGRNEQMARLGSVAPWLANLGLHNPASRFLAEKVMGIARQAPLPRWSTRGTFGNWFKQTRERRLRSDMKVVYFHGCSTMYYEPFIGQAAVAVLEHNGYEVVVPPQNCCGLPMLSNGEFEAAAGYYDNNINHLVSYARAGLPIVGTSTSCTLTLKEEAPEMLDVFSPEAMALKLATWDIFEWLEERHELGELRTDFRRLEMTLPYHAPCQFRAHRVGKPALEVMALVPGLELRDSPARCCGIAGTYGYKVEKYQIAMDVGAELFDFVEAQGPAVKMTACDSETCRWQLEHGTGRPSRHPIEYLAAAYGLYDLEKRQLVT
ncbi:MAG: anaerobic glycerol-3-phosphate dehydrogenase subunit C [Chloroflexi bacterium]|nr:anaerobic glycerol-3-phosphate dehydrogenase subunit C [Chloroflexota bacterium]MCI0575327.1 anaerobic glycerol-3-phosphate dehydrogenase subunit C [Chloroflexota bacterium]MCI0647318.1 anaerobic glycerol-3-phosphate dehydrogenase subunit C [Chloroflexota bacterium]MCI0725797.1 anaerobic glycerol-3-phosphate dehydrogenase subunit C [Chloroflexota bacterium]